jgi:glycosyltransferase involved in cell wall biosynthesis
VRNGEATIARALEAVLEQIGERDEVIVVDDTSTDRSAEIVSGYPVRLVRLSEHRNLGAARNVGAAEARGEILLFTDADGVLGPGALERAYQRLIRTGGCDALVGIYAAEGGPTDPVSTIKNLWVRYTYLRSGRGEWIDWAFGCLLLIRKSLFEEIGGFKERYERDWGGEDIELGLRLVRGGHRILFDPEVEVSHLRRFTLGGLLVNDFRRAAGFLDVGLSELGLEELLRKRRFANIETEFLLGVALVASSLPLLAGGIACPPLLGLAAVAVAGYLALNIPYYGYLRRHGGAGLALSGGALLAASQLASLGGMAYGALGRVLC